MPNLKRLTRGSDLTTEFTTYDLGTTAALMAMGYSLKEVKKRSTSRSLFVFETSKGLVCAAQNYWQRNLSVDALTFFNCIKALKNQLYSN